MGNKEILKIAKKVKKDLKGKTDFLSIENYLEDLNYTVVFYNTPNGDKELTRYGLSDKAGEIKAFTYLGSGRVVFIDNNVSAEDKRLLICHELGHIALGHLRGRRGAQSRSVLSTMNRTVLEMEADTFTNYLINDNEKDYKATALLCALASAGAVIGTMLLKKAVKADA